MKNKNADGKSKKIYARPEYCMACRLCEIACFVKHSKSKKIIKAFRDERGDFRPRIIVEQSGPVSFALQCRHCDDAPCIEACISGAMSRKPDGTVACGEDKCAGCWSCIMVCPFGVISQDRRRKKIASKCDMCPDKNTPACVEACPNEALVYE